MAYQGQTNVQIPELESMRRLRESSRLREHGTQGMKWGQHQEHEKSADSNLRKAAQFAKKAGDEQSSTRIMAILKSAQEKGKFTGEHYTQVDNQVGHHESKLSTGTKSVEAAKYHDAASKHLSNALEDIERAQELG